MQIKTVRIKNNIIVCAHTLVIACLPHFFLNSKTLEERKEKRQLYASLVPHGNILNFVAVCDCIPSKDL